MNQRTVEATPAGENRECFDCGGFGPCDFCGNPISSAADIARDLSRHGLLTAGSCEAAREIIERHVVANMQLASAPCELIDALRER